MIKNMLKNIYLSKKFGVIISKTAKIGISACFEGKNKIGQDTVFDGYLGRGSYIGSRSWIERASIGRYCSIANNVMLAVGRHPTEMVSQHPMFYSTAKQNGYSYVRTDVYEERLYADEDNRYDVIIGNDVWIGTGAIILGNVKVGTGAVIGAGTVVTKDVPEYAIVTGVPAKVVRYRFSDTEINKLLSDKWWEKDEKWICNNVKSFCDISEYSKLIE